MKRKIEFRGKEKDNEKWVYGSLIITDDSINNPFQSTPAKKKYQICQYDAGDWNLGGWSYYDIYPVTVGRLIGKKDIKDIPIYEGDIFKFKFMEELNKLIELIGSFIWNDEDLRYEIDIYSNEHPEYVCLHYAGNGQMYDFEIIGNIFDNAELLNK